MKDVIYRKCACGETAFHGKARKNAKGEWERYYACRNCRAEKPVSKKRKSNADVARVDGVVYGCVR